MSYIGCATEKNDYVIVRLPYNYNNYKIVHKFSFVVQCCITTEVVRVCENMYLVWSTVCSM